MGLDVLTKHINDMPVNLGPASNNNSVIMDDEYISSHVKISQSIIEEIQLSSDIAISELSDFLFYDKVRSNRLGQLELKLVDGWKFINLCVKPFFIQANALAITIAISFSDGYHDLYQPMIYVDEAKMKQVVRNLLSNALKFSRRGSTVQVRLSKVDDLTTQTNEYSSLLPINDRNGLLRVEVIDEGPGISSEDQAKLFNQYVQINPNKLQDGKGSGLGLWCKSY